MRRLGSLTLPGLDVVSIEYAPHSVSPHGGGFSSHFGHEFNYLISGSLNFEVGDQQLTLSAGDSLAFPSSEPHRISNPGDERAEALTLFIRGDGQSRRTS